MIEVQLNPDVQPTGSDLSIVNAARRSFNTRSEWDWSKELESGTGDGRTLKHKDKRLLEFLARGMTANDFDRFVGHLHMDGASIVNSDWQYPEDTEDFVKQLWQWRTTPTHDTPFNHTFISFEVKAPIFVRAQLVKHEYLIMSEFSRRYITDGIEFYTPDVWRKAAENKKQGSLDEGINSEYNPAYNNSSALYAYHQALDHGVAPEQARMVLPQSTMTEWTWSGTLGAFAKMCTLRLHPEAQYEARPVAQQVYDRLKEYWPVAAKALVEGTDL
jgi:thymidylate synthase (FAD)